MKIKVINKSKNALPSYETIASAGMDLRADLDAAIVLKPMQRKIIPTGLYIELSAGYEAQIRPRSGLAIKHGITLLNSPGTIDADYRGEIGVILVNLSLEDFKIESGDRIAQIVFAKYEQIHWEQVTELSETERGTGGFGSTGNN